MQKKKDHGKQTEAISMEAALGEMLMALVRAHDDPRRRTVQERGLEERDLAFEAGLLTPPQMEITIYGTQHRNRVMRLLREMAARGWCQIERLPPIGAYHVKLLPAGREIASQQVETTKRPWWSRFTGGKGK